MGKWELKFQVLNIHSFVLNNVDDFLTTSCYMSSQAEEDAASLRAEIQNLQQSDRGHDSAFSYMPEHQEIAAVKSELEVGMFVPTFLGCLRADLLVASLIRRH